MAVAIAEQLYTSAQTVPRPIEVVKMAATLMSGALAGNQLLWPTHVGDWRDSTE